MLFYSTRSHTGQKGTTLADAVMMGLAADGGLFMPESIPALDKDTLQQLPEMSLPEIAATILSQLLGDDIDKSTMNAICEKVFDFPMPLIEIEKNRYCLELFHGPTLAFKDVGARFMAALLGHFANRTASKIKVIAATSGDTGSAVAAGFFGVKGTEVYILYPQGKVSELQEKQLTTWGGNIKAIEVKGNFDDCQRIAKQILNDKSLHKSALITSANSINIARLLPQAVYYAFVWSRLKKHDKRLVISVPSGNFGNLTAGLIAQKMGVPIHHFIASTNVNNVVPDYLDSGSFRPRASIATISNAMDVGDPSNFERMLYLFDNEHEKMQKVISGFTFSDQQTKAQILTTYRNLSYLLDPHGAVGLLGLQHYFEENKLDAIGVFLETAHPAKFAETIESVINQSVEIPESLNAFAAKKKNSMLCEIEYEAVKNIILQ